MSDQIKTLNGEINLDQLQGEKPDRAFRDAWKLDGNVITLDPSAKNETLKKKINKERTRRISLGQSITLSDGRTFVVQTRTEEDFRNLNGLVSKALVYAMAQQLEAEIYFRDAANNVQTLTPAQMIECGELVAASVQAIYQASWDLKALSTIPDNYADDEHWP